MDKKLIPLALLSAYFLKVLIFSSTYTDCLALCILAATFVLTEKQSKDSKLAALHEAIDQKTKDIKDLQAELLELNTKVSTIRLPQQFKPQIKI